MKRCLFCAEDNLTREHLISRPIAVAFGIDRNTDFARFTPGEAEGMNIQPLNNLQVRLVCGKCNASWMNDLEHDMAAVGRYLKSDRCGRLGTARFDTIRAWLLKTYLVLSAIEGGITKFADVDGEPRFRVIPELTRARQLHGGDFAAAFEGVHYGFARTSDLTRFGYSFGNPTVEPVGPRYAGVRSAGAAALALGGVQLWIVVPFMPGATCQFPRGVPVLTQHLDVKRVRHVSFMPDSHQAIVDNGNHDIVALNASLADWATAQAS